MREKENESRDEGTNKKKWKAQRRKKKTNQVAGRKDRIDETSEHAIVPSTEQPVPVKVSEPTAEALTCIPWLRPYRGKP